MKSVMLKIYSDLIVFIILAFLTMLNFTEIGQSIQQFFVVMYRDYPAAIAWDDVKYMMFNPPMNMMSPSIMQIMPKMTEMVALAEVLMGLFSNMFVWVTLITMCAFRVIVRILFSLLTKRKYTFSEIDIIDMITIPYYFWFISVYYDYRRVERLEPFLIMSGIVDTSDEMSVFAVNMMFNADTR